MPSASEQPMQEWRPIEAAARYLRRNAARTMGGSVIRGLVELITNARDSAYRMLSAGLISVNDLPERAVEVNLIVNSSGKRLLVRDRFEGMSEADMRGRLLKYGATAS